MFETLTLEPLRLPKDAPVQRRPLLRPAAQPANFAERYDFSTLAYSATFLPERGRIVLVCPKLLNLAGLLRGATFRSELGVHPVTALRRYRRHDELWVRARACPSRLSVVLDGEELSISVAVPDEAFAGKVVLSTLSRNNPLPWVRDWAAHYVASAGVEHVLFFDNGSTEYGLEDIRACLASVEGLSGATVVGVDVPYGPMAAKPPRGIALFLQLGIINTIRHRYFPHARGLIWCDVDEMLVAADGAGTLVEQAERSRLGYATARCHWRYAVDAAGEVPMHGDHIWRRDPETYSKEKWCITRGSPLARFGWDVHGVAGYLFNRVAMSRSHRFMHCAQISTGWKGQRIADAESLVRDAGTEALWQRAGLATSLGGGA
ncbi:hypothetical protein FHY55_13525 [Oceanicola sp. D3]|uniref:hypothetical protein n=1 Tax=Oceanicola sp. D3 TaxID=2587163 RepID=UPI00111FCF75|nr:hypothetical protein [Oceanicola sp. D3]QDC10204.1 hypothetical protein FHY55_13525 [Oceanicola sp. D3]